MARRKTEYEKERTLFGNIIKGVKENLEYFNAQEIRELRTALGEPPDVKEMIGELENLKYQGDELADQMAEIRKRISPQEKELDLLAVDHNDRYQRYAALKQKLWYVFGQTYLDNKMQGDPRVNSENQQIAHAYYYKGIMPDRSKG